MDILLEATVGCVLFSVFAQWALHVSVDMCRAPLWFLDVVLEVTLASFSADRMTALTDSELAAVHLLLTSVLRRCVELALPTSPSLIRSLLRLLSHASQSGDSRHRVWISREMLAGVLVAHACAAHVDGCQASCSSHVRVVVVVFTPSVCVCVLVVPHSGC